MKKIFKALIGIKKKLEDNTILYKYKKTIDLIKSFNILIIKLINITNKYYVIIK